jgi:hypothetical protein
MTVYVLQCQQTRNVKIGYTARMVQDRLKELKTAASTPLELVKWYPGLTQSHEQQLHATLGQYRVTGEWFKHDALHMVDNAAESLFATGERDFTANCQGKAVSVQTASVSISVLKLNGQNLKKAIVDQLPEADFYDIFNNIDGYKFMKNCIPWGWVRTKDFDILLTQIRGVLHGNAFSRNLLLQSMKESYEKARFIEWPSLEEGYIVQDGSEFAFIQKSTREHFTLNDKGEEDFALYIEFLRSLPQLFLA